MATVAEAAGTVNCDQSLIDARAIWRVAVTEIAEKAKAALPECNGRVEKAVALVLNGDVDVLPDGTARVASQSNGQTVYHIVNGHCDCTDYPNAPQGFCKHRLAHAIAKRAYPLAKAQLEAASQPASAALVRASEPVAAHSLAPTAPLPEAPASVNVHLELAGRQVQLTLRDRDAGRWLARLEAILQRFPLVVKPTEDTRPCPRHGVPMQVHHKDGRAWWSHQTPEGWCKGKAPAPPGSPQGLEAVGAWEPGSPSGEADGAWRCDRCDTPLSQPASRGPASSPEGHAARALRPWHSVC